VAAALGLAAHAAAAPAPNGSTACVDNPWFPLPPGTVWVYRAVKDGQAARHVVTVERTTKRIDGWTPLEPASAGSAPCSSRR
jgi:hypothetical protein